MSKKHYVGILRDQSLYTKGMNYICRSGSTLSSVVSEEFVRIVLSTTDINLTRLKLGRVCAEYKWKVSSGKYPHLLDINMKYMGRRSNYMRVTSVSGDSHKYIESGGILGPFNIDIGYYHNIIRMSLEVPDPAIP